MHKYLWMNVLFALILVLGVCSSSGNEGRDVNGLSETEKPASLPARAALQLYSADSPLNRKVPVDATVDPNSDGYVNLIVEAAQTGGFIIELKQYSAPVYFADINTSRKNIWLACGQDWGNVEYLKGVPMPDFAEPAHDVDGANNPIPAGECGEFSDQDNQMIILDLETRCEYDFWQMRKENGQWVASWANSISMNSTGIYEKGLSARGSGFTTLSGLIWPDELEKGQINHALIFSYPYPRAGAYVSPATESDGTSKEQYALPEGARVQLDPNLDLGSLNLTPVEKTIAKVLQEYGMYLVDVGGSGVSIEAVDPKSVKGNPYEGLLPDVDYPSLENIPLDRLQMLQLPPIETDLSTALIPSGCGYME